MFGYRLVREADYAAVQDSLLRVRGRERDLLLERAQLKADAAGAMARADHLTIRNNILEHEVAAFRERATGMPQMVATIQPAPAQAPSVEDATLSTLEDVGDERAHELRSRGLLHDDVDDMAFPSAGDMAPSVEAE